MNMLSREQRKQLRAILEKLYPNEDRSRLLLEDANIKTNEIRFDAAAKTNWSNIISEVEKQKATVQLIHEVLDQFPGTIELDRILREITSKNVKRTPKERAIVKRSGPKKITELVKELEALINIFQFKNIKRSSCSNALQKLEKLQPELYKAEELTISAFYRVKEYCEGSNASKGLIQTIADFKLICLLQNDASESLRKDILKLLKAITLELT